jgi:LPPG:FO 2-phospho-L-lactate transferase
LTAVVLAGGTGGAKLAAGAQDELGAELAVVANTGDDIEALGVHVSPDPDLCTYWLSGEIDSERGWGITEDTFTVFERLHKLGAPGWFTLGDRDLATCLERRRLLDSGLSQTEAQLRIGAALGLSAQVLPMCDEPVRTRVRTPDGWLGLQQYLVGARAEPSVSAVEYEGLEGASPSAAVREALERSEAILIGPSNPVISIGPILAVPGMRELLARAPAPVVAVSPFVGGEVVKGPTEKFMQAAGHEPSATGVAAAYSGVIDGLVFDANDPEVPSVAVPTLALDTLMDSVARRREVAATALEFCATLR